MPRPTSISRRDRIYTLTLAAFVGSLLSAFMIRRGIPANPDSWAYWQGSVSILETHRYKLFFFDQDIEAWPPLYSLFLALFQGVFGISGSTLSLSIVALSGATAASWTWLWWDTFPGADIGPKHKICGLCVAILAGTYWAAHSSVLMASTLTNLLIPLLLAAVIRLREKESGAAGWLTMGTAGGLGCLVMLAHNSSIAVVGACAVLLTLRPRVSILAQAAGCLAFVALSLGPTFFVKHALGQLGSHPVSLGHGQYSWLHYCAQVMRLLSSELLYFRYFPADEGFRWVDKGLVLLTVSGIAALFTALFWSRQAMGAVGDRLTAQVVFLCLYAAAMVCLFSNIWIPNDISSGYINSCAWLVISVTTTVLVLKLKPRVSSVCCAVLALWIGSKFVLIQGLHHGKQPAVRWPDIITRDMVITHTYSSGDPVKMNGKTIVAPPCYPFLKERMDALATGVFPDYLRKGNPNYRDLGW